MRARLDDGSMVRAHLANTGRMTGLLVPGVPLLLRPSSDPTRRTGYSVHRVRDGETMVAVDAAEATRLLEERLLRRPWLPRLGAVSGWRREVGVAGHRIDFRIDLADGRGCWTEVKSLSLARRGDALFSRTPSSRGRAHLELLGDRVEAGEAAACIFVVQRDDVRRLVAETGADPGWLAAIRRARQRGVELLAFRCRVTAREVRIAGAIPIRLGRLRAFITAPSP